ncbi:MAG: hypothetical protein AMXMBFR56_47040 [Polyangiaceae bacterium]
MGARVALLSALVLVVHACGGDEFSDTSSGGGGTGAATGGGGAGGAGGAGGSGGASGSGGVSGGGTSGASGGGGASGSAGDASTGGSAGDAGTDASGDADAGPPAIAVVQSTPVKLTMAPTQTSAITLAAAPVAGNAIIVGVSCISDFGVVIGDGGGALVNGDCLMPPGSVSDNQGNTYTQVVQGVAITSSHQAARGYIFIAQPIGAPSGSFTITVDPEGTSAGQGIAWGAIEVAGLSAPPSLDATGYTASANGTSTTAATFQATTQANELAVAVLTIRHNAVYAGIVPDNTWVSHQIHQDSLTGPPAHSMVSKIQTATGKPSHTWAHAAPSRGAAGVIATFKGAATN